MELTVETYCNLLARSSLLTPQEVKVMYQRWRNEARDAPADVDRFTKWLVTKQYLTEYQAKLVGRGQIDNFFLSQYKLLDRIGKGRMAGIYKGVHRLGQVVAIKVLPPSRAKIPEMFTRFQREARMAMQLKHANVVRTFQMAESNGLFYIVMEYLEGEPLEEILKRRGKLSPVEAVRIVHQALQGLQHIHEQGLVHRDLKPANIMLVPAPEPNGTTLHSNVKLLDIGLGKVMFDEEEIGADENQLTTDGAVLGSPIYMAPEQARNAHAADVRSDIYTLGCVLYHALAGQPPFMDQNVVQIMIKHASETPRPVRDFNPAIPENLQQVVNRMLAKDPGQRIPTPDRAAQSLQPFLSTGTDKVKPLEAEPQMAAYLKWLDNEEPADVPVGIPAAAPPPAAAPVAPAAPAVVRPGGSHPRRRPVPPPPPPPPEEQSGPDVELVPVGGAGLVPRGMHDADKGAGNKVLILGIIIGVGGALLAVLIALLIFRFLIT